MENSRPGRLAEWETHGFRSMEDLDVANIMEEATTRWLRPNEIHAILCNHNHFNISVKPVNLPKSGTIILFDRKMLRNFRKDGHNWKKKKDGKTVKEAHEHLKVGNEERIHVYYAHGQDNPNFVRRCYWLLDKKQEHIVLVHYRETIELQGSPATPVSSNSNSGSSYSNPFASRVSSEETDSVARPGFYAGDVPFPTSESTELGYSMTIVNHERRLHELNTLEWEDLVASHEPHNSTVPKSNGSLLPTNNSAKEISSFGHPTKVTAESATDVKHSDSDQFQTMGGQFKINIQRKDFQIGGADESLDIYVEDKLQNQDSFGRWMNYIMTDSPGSLDDQLLESSTGDESSVFATTNCLQPSIQEQIFSITDVSPAWAFSTDETKVIVIGFFHEEHSYFAGSKLVFVFGNVCVPAEKVQLGVFRCLALPHAPGLVNFYLSFDGRTPISQFLTFEYRSPPRVDRVPSPENMMKWEEFQVLMRLMHLLFSTSKSLDILSNKVSTNALKEAKRFAHATSFIDKDWSYLTKTIQNNEISFPQAKDGLFELTLKIKLRDWLLERVVEGCKTTVCDHQGQGVIHLCAILGYTWAVRPFSSSQLSLDFRDANGWTALHWAAFYGRNQMVAVLLTAGAKPNLVTDPTPENPGGCTAADLASKNGYAGLSAFLAEKGLIAHFEDMSLAGNVSGSLLTRTDESANTATNLSEEELSLKDTLAAYRTAADAAARIQAAFREHSLKLRTDAVQCDEPEIEARSIIAAMRIQHAFRNYETRKRMAAAARIQHGFRSWKIRKEFLNMRRHAIKIQAVFRGFQVRRQYRKILWSVGVLEKAILRWRHKRKGFRGLQVEPVEAIAVDQEKDVEDFFQISRKQADERVERSVVRVQAMFRSKQAQQEYRKMKLAHEQAKLEYGLLDPDVDTDW